MRKKKFEINDLSKAEELYDELVGRLGLITDSGYPRIIPVNFVVLNSKVYFHGALAGEKFELLKANPKCTFAIDKPYAYLPSNWFDEEDGCNATLFYKSVYMEAVGTVVDDVDEKCQALQALMEKHQSVDTFLKVTPAEQRYEKSRLYTGIFSLAPVKIDIKFKFGQNLSVEKRKDLIAKLKKRNNPVDLATADEIAKTIDS